MDPATEQLLEIRRQEQAKQDEAYAQEAQASQDELARRIELAKQDPSMNVQEWSGKETT